MRHDEPATMMHLIRPLLLLLGVFALLLVVDQAWGDSVRVYDVAGSDGPEVTLAQVAEIDGEHAGRYAQVVVGRFEEGTAKLQLKTASILEALREDGARLGMIDFSGFAQCVVHRTFNKPQRVTSDESEPAAANFDQRGGGGVTIHSPTTVKSLIEQRVAKELGIGKASLEIAFNERDADLLARSAVAGRFEVSPSTAISLGKVGFEVQGYEGTRKQGRPETIHAHIQQRVIAVIAGDAIARGERITRRSVRLSEVLLDDPAQPYLQETSLVTGQVASSVIRAGELVTSSKVELPVAVKRRERVSVELNKRGIKITFNAVAHDDGAVGETIEVENTLTRERFRATVVGRGKVVAGQQAQTNEQTNKQANESTHGQDTGAQR